MDELAKKKGKEISEEVDKLIEQWVNARDEKDYLKQSDITSQLHEFFKSNKGLISVLKSLNDDEATCTALYLESQASHYKQLSDFETQKTISSFSGNKEGENELSHLLATLRDSTREIDDTIGNQISTLNDVSFGTYNTNDKMKGLVQGLKNFDKDTMEIIILAIIIFILFAIAWLIYSKRIRGK